jgi:hypothetical protein
VAARARAGRCLVSGARHRRRAAAIAGDPSRRRAAGALPANLSLLVPPATRAGELWLSFDSPAGRAWTVGDAFFNIARTPRTPIGFLLWLLGISPGLRVGASFRWLVRDRGAYRRWLLDTIAAQRPTTLIPCHGDILTDPQLPDRLQRLVERRF